jgi:chemotaxis protein CheC
MDAKQLASLSEIVQQSADEASSSLSRWIGKDVRVVVDPLGETSLEGAMDVIGQGEETVCACCMRVSGSICGQLILSFDDASGLALCEALISGSLAAQDPDAAVTAESAPDAVGAVWGELERSAVMETANILGCAFLNALTERVPMGAEGRLGKGSLLSCMPSPPVFIRDFAASVMQFVLLDQVAEIESVLIAKTHFSIERAPVSWQLLLLPDNESLTRMLESLS